MENDNANKFNKFLKSHETFQLALTEAVHRYFYDECFSGGKGSRLLDTEEARLFFDLHQSLFCLCPDWRFKLKENLKRYLVWEKTDAIHVDSKPRRELSINFSVEVIVF